MVYLGVDETVDKGGEEYDIHLVRFDPGVLDENRSGEVKTQRYRIDAVLEFNSVRKRMSVMVRDETGRCFVYTKGAEVAMLDARVSFFYSAYCPLASYCLSLACGLCAAMW